MLPARANIPARRRWLVGVLTLVPLIAAASLAWACVPTARTAVNPVSGAAGTQATMTGDGFPNAAQTVDIYLNDKAPASLLKGGVPMTEGNNGEKAFSTRLTMPSTAGAHLLIPVPRDSSGADVGTVSSGAGPPAAVFQVTNPTLSVTPGSGWPGVRATVSGTHFRSGTVTLHWDSADGPQLGSATATGTSFGFTGGITIPASGPGSHRVVAVPLGAPSDTASAAFRVVLPPPVAGPFLDNVGPAIVAAALTSQNRTRTVSRRGVVTLFCGEFAEPGVTGDCGARSVKKLRLPRARKSTVLKLAKKSFRAESGKPVKLRFRLKKTAMRMLKAAKRVRMRGTVSARDSSGNASPAVSFGFSLKAPRR